MERALCWGKVLNAREMAWLRSNLAGFIRRRTESMGRWDHDGMRYSRLDAAAIVLGKGELYCAAGKAACGGSRLGQLARVPLAADGTIEAKPLWNARVQHRSADSNRTTGNFAIEAMIVAGDRLFLAGHEESKSDSAVHAYSTKDGSRVEQWTLPSRPVRTGLAAVPGRLIIACEEGELVCLRGTDAR